MLRPIPLIGNKGAETQPDFDAQLTENMYVQPGEPGAKSPAALVSRRGYEQFQQSTSGATAVRAMAASPRTIQPRALAYVEGATQRLYAKTVDGASPWEPFGPLQSDIPPFPAGGDFRRKAAIAVNDEGTRWAVTNGTGAFGGFRFVLSPSGVSSPAGWTYETPSTLATDVVFLDRRFVILGYDDDNITPVLRHTDLNSTTINILNKELTGVHAIAIAKLDKEVWVFGTDGIEVWYNDGSAGFTYARRDGASLAFGLFSANATANVSGTLFAVVRDSAGAVFVGRVDGYQIARVSTPSVDKYINEKLALDEYACDAFVLAYSGHNFLVLRFRNFAGAGFSLCLDILTNHWFALSRQNGDVEEPFGCMSAIVYGRDAFLGSATDGRFFTLGRDDTIASDAGLAFRKRRRMGRVASPTAARHSRFELRAKTGAWSSPTEPQVMLRWSDDGGRTFGEERVASLGQQGEYVKRMAFRRLGSTRDRVYEITIADSVPVTLIETLADIVATAT